MRNVFWVIAAAVLAITVHIGTVLFAPGFLFDRNLNLLANDVPDNTFFILPSAAQSKIFPEYPSGTVFGLCRFNLTSGPITLDASLPDGIWTLTVYSRFGKTLYTVTDEQSGVNKFSLQLAMAPSMFDVFLLKGDDNQIDLRVGQCSHRMSADLPCSGSLPWIRPCVRVLWTPFPRVPAGRLHLSALPGEVNSLRRKGIAPV